PCAAVWRGVPAQTTTAASWEKNRTTAPVGVRDAYQQRAGYTFKVSYSISGMVGKQPLGGRLVSYQVPPLRRVDTTLGAGRNTQSFTLYIDESSIVICALPFTPPCEPISPEDAASAGLGVVLLDAPILENPQILDKAEVSEDRIAGQPVSCFLIREPGSTKLQPGASL